MPILILLVALAGCARGGFGTDNVELVNHNATPPFVIVDVSPGAGTTQTVFAFSGARSWDREDGQGNLIMRWDWDADGGSDESGPTTTHQFSSEGVHAVALSVEDSDGQVGWGTVHVIVAPATDLVVVSTADDTVANDGETSLREANNSELYSTYGPAKGDTYIHRGRGRPLDRLVTRSMSFSRERQMQSTRGTTKVTSSSKRSAFLASASESVPHLSNMI